MRRRLILIISVLALVGCDRAAEQRAPTAKPNDWLLGAADDPERFRLIQRQLKKIKTTIENGIAKRPARRANAEAMFLSPVWADVDADLRSGDRTRAWRGFERAKTACQGCHQAEQVAYMNDQSVFDLSAPQGAAR